MRPDIRLSDNQLFRLRLRAQRLALPSDEAVSSVAQVVKDLCGIQAQEAPSAALAVRPRSRGLTAMNVEYARVEERTIIRTWGLRGTLHLLATEDFNWLLHLLGPVFIVRGRRRREELGLDEDLCARGIRIIRDALADQGPLTRAELVEQLATHGLRIEGQARPYLLSRAALEGFICFGPNRGAEPTYVLIADWIGREYRGNTLPESEAHAELSRRYLAAYGPATPVDQAAWSGLSLKETRAAWGQIADELIEIEAAGAPAWMLKMQAAWLDEPPADTPTVRLLPRFDIYLLGYQNRDFAVPRQHAKRVNAGGGILHPTVLVDGRVAGIWKSKFKKNSLEVVVEPFEPLAPQAAWGLEAEADDLGRFLNVQARLEIATPG